MQESEFKHTYLCRICGQVVDLETCKTDEHGMAVHENCYVVRVALAGESKRGGEQRKPANGITALGATGTRLSLHPELM